MDFFNQEAALRISLIVLPCKLAPSVKSLFKRKTHHFGNFKQQAKIQPCSCWGQGCSGKTVQMQYLGKSAFSLSHCALEMPIIHEWIYLALTHGVHPSLGCTSGETEDACGGKQRQGLSTELGRPLGLRVPLTQHEGPALSFGP